MNHKAMRIGEPRRSQDHKRHFLRGLGALVFRKVIPMLHTFVVYVDNKPGVLNRVASLFRRRAFNIESLTVGHTEEAGVSRMTVVVDTDAYGARRLEANLYKLVPVKRVDDISAAPSIVARPCADQGDGNRRGADARHATRRRLSRTRRRR